MTSQIMVVLYYVKFKIFVVLLNEFSNLQIVDLQLLLN